jgi:hypothetical protein
MDRQYDVEEWAAATTRGRHVFNHNYRLLGGEFRGWELLKVVAMKTGQVPDEKVYLWNRKGDPGRDMVRVDVAERSDWRLAQERLRDELANSMRPDIPRATGTLARLGDVSFVSRDPQSDVPAAISFTRGNVCVLVNSVGENNVDVSELATRVDRLLSEPPAKAEVEKRRVHVRPPKAVAVKADKAHVLIKNVKAAAPRGEWLKIIAPDGELTRRGNALIYVSPKDGKRRIGIFESKQ